MKKLIVGPFKKSQTQTLITIDALGECKAQELISVILIALSKHVDQVPNIKFLITGRPLDKIHFGFFLPPLHPFTKILSLREVECALVDNDIKLFLKAGLVRVANTHICRRFPNSWASPQDVYCLFLRTAGLFTYASTFIKFIDSRSFPPPERLNVILSLSESGFYEPRPEMDLLPFLEQVSRGGPCQESLPEW